MAKFVKTTPAEKKAKRKYDKKHFDTIGVKSPKGIKQLFQFIAYSRGMNVSTYLMGIVMDVIDSNEGTDIMNIMEEDYNTLTENIYYEPKTDEQLYPKNKIEFIFELYNKGVAKRGKVETYDEDNKIIYSREYISKMPPLLLEKFLEEYNEEYYKITNEMVLWNLLYRANSNNEATFPLYANNKGRLV